MGSYQELTNYPSYDAGLAARNDPTQTNSLFLGVFITLIPKVRRTQALFFSSLFILFYFKLLPRIMPVFMKNSAPEIKAKFDSPDFVENNEEMLKEEFTKYFQVMFFL